MQGVLVHLGGLGEHALAEMPREGGGVTPLFGVRYGWVLGGEVAFLLPDAGGGDIARQCQWLHVLR